nr:MAG TPA: hypothetical protein [Caudoviricetes sp.]
MLFQLLKFHFLLSNYIIRYSSVFMNSSTAVLYFSGTSSSAIRPCLILDA